MRIHVAHLNPLAYCVGEVAFQAISRGKLDAPLARDEKDDQPVVGLFPAHSVFPSQPVSEIETISAFYLPYRYH